MGSASTMHRVQLQCLVIRWIVHNRVRAFLSSFSLFSPLAAFAPNQRSFAPNQRSFAANQRTAVFSLRNISLVFLPLLWKQLVVFD